MKKLLFLLAGLLLSQTVFAQSISIFDGRYVYFKGGDDHRHENATVSLPPRDEDFEKITLNFSLTCPQDNCDWWDRKGALYIKGQKGSLIEIFRFMTPYGVGADWAMDVTDLRPLLTGRQHFQVFIDTWVGPGHSQGNGWLVHTSLEYKAGRPQRPVAAVMPIFNPTSVVYGDPARSPDRTQYLAIPPSISGGRIWVFITGHGQGNTQNCAEFCPKRHTIDLDGQQVKRAIWRDDCTATRTHGPQQGSWQYPRAGWCPGDMVHPWIIDVPKDALLGEGNFTWIPEPWENYNRSGYNTGSHTEPYYQLSALLILYR